MSVPKYAQRIARLPDVFERLAAHPRGVPLTDLADDFGAPVEELRQDLLAFYTADVGVLLGLSRPTVLEFVGGEGDDDPNSADVVRIVEERPTDELGVEYVDASELALIYTAAEALLEIDPHDSDLAAAVDVLTETMLGGPLAQGRPGGWNRPLEPLQDAAQQHRRVRIEYSRSWRVGVNERVIDPYRLVQTRRGWEVDAGPPDDSGALRTFLLSNIRSVDVLDETFELPGELSQMLEEQRSTSRVRVRLPHAARWAADMYAEHVTVVEGNEAAVTLDLDLLPPLEHRVGLLLLVSGLDSAVLDPARLVAAAPALASELVRHHRG